MQHVVQEIVDELVGFISHADERVMLIEAEDGEAPLLLKSFGIVEESDQVPEIFFSFGEPFLRPVDYVQELVTRQSDQIRDYNSEAPSRDMPQLDPLPAPALDRRTGPTDRLRGLLAHMRRIVEPERGIVWILYPIDEVADEDGFVEFLGPVVRDILSGEPPATKLIIRDTPSNRFREIFHAPDDEPAIRLYRPEVDFKSVMKKVEERAADPSAPIDERMQGTMLLAGVDVAEKRYDDALEKNRTVLNFYRQRKQPENESIVRNNIGDIYYLQGDFPTAQKNYEAAITISTEQKSQPLVLYQCMNLGNSLFMQNKFDEALIYYNSAEKLAAANKLIIQRISAIERVGDSKKAGGDVEEAIEIWESGAEICRKEPYKVGLKHLLERLTETYREIGEDEKAAKAERELAKCREDLTRLDPAFAEA